MNIDSIGLQLSFFTCRDGDFLDLGTDRKARIHADSCVDSYIDIRTREGCEAFLGNRHNVCPGRNSRDGIYSTVARGD